MTKTTRNPTKNFASFTADILLDIKAINFNTDTYFTLASGKCSPVYVDCRRIISFPEARKEIINMMVELVYHRVGSEYFQNIAGGETAGIPFAALVAKELHLPMTYVRKKPKGYGKNARIEGLLAEGDNVLLVEDLATDGGSKFSFVDAIRSSGGICNYSLVIFYYDIFPEAASKLKAHGIELLHLTTWEAILNSQKTKTLLSKNAISEVSTFLEDPGRWQEKNCRKN